MYSHKRCIETNVKLFECFLSHFVGVNFFSSLVCIFTDMVLELWKELASELW